MVLFSVRYFFSSLQIANAISSEKLIRTDDSWLTQLLATHNDCSEQYNMKQISLTPAQKCTQAPPEIEYTRSFASVFIRPKAENFKPFRCSATIEKNRIFFAQVSHYNWYRHDRMDWHIKSMP